MKKLSKEAMELLVYLHNIGIDIEKVEVKEIKKAD